MFSRVCKSGQLGDFVKNGAAVIVKSLIKFQNRRLFCTCKGVPYDCEKQCKTANFSRTKSRAKTCTHKIGPRRKEPKKKAEKPYPFFLTGFSLGAGMGKKTLLKKIITCVSECNERVGLPRTIFWPEKSRQRAYPFSLSGFF